MVQIIESFEKKDPFEVTAVIPVLLEEKKCENCEFRFLCFTNRERNLITLNYEIRRELNNNDEFRATFDLSFGCASLDSIRERARQPNFVKFKGMNTVTQSYEIVHNSEGTFLMVVGILI